jgi:hypothetical protein
MCHGYKEGGMQYVLMAIPAQFVPEVAALIAEFDVPSPASLPQGVGDDGLMINGWTEDLVRRAFRESADPMRKVLMFLAHNSGEEVTAVEIADAIDAERGWNTVAGMLGAFGRRSVNRYKRAQPMWESREGVEGTLYKMPAAVATVIKAAATKQ